MNMIVVWILIIYSHGYTGTSTVVIDNISSQQECMRAAEQLASKPQAGVNVGQEMHCASVTKVKQ